MFAQICVRSLLNFYLNVLILPEFDLILLENDCSLNSFMHIGADVGIGAHIPNVLPMFKL